MVCVEQLTTEVKLNGSGFAPMPTKTLEDRRALVLPEVTLLRTADLAGASASGQLRVPDGPEDPAASYLKWISEAQMSFRVDPALKMEAGIYDIRVLNPDGKKETVFRQGLGAVPRPTLTAAEPDLFCNDDSDVTVTVTGTTLLQVGEAKPTVRVASKDGTSKDLPVDVLLGCQEMAGVHKAKVLLCTGGTFVIPKGSFEVKGGEVSIPLDVTLTNPAPANCASTDAVQLVLVPRPSVASIQPDLVCNAQGDVSLTVSGAGLLKVGSALPRVMIGTEELTPSAAEDCVAVAAPAQGPFAEGEVSSCKTLKVTLPQGKLAEGAHGVVVTNPPPAACKSTEVVSLYIAPPPSLTSLSTVIACESSETTLTLQGQKFLKVGDALPSVQIGGKEATVTGVSGCTELPGPFAAGKVEECTGVTVTIPGGSFTPGEYDVVVTNPAPAGCESTEAIKLRIVAPPTVASVAPKNVCSGGSLLTITGSGFYDGVTTVTLRAPGKPDVNSSKTDATPDEDGSSMLATLGPGAEVGTSYDVIVSNGAGCEAPPFSSVTVVPGPIMYLADPEYVYNGINTKVTVYVTGASAAPAISLIKDGEAAGTALQVAPDPQKTNRFQITIAKGTPAGDYDLVFSDETGCASELDKAIRVIDQLTIPIERVSPSFGWKSTETPITILRDKIAPAPTNKPFIVTPRAFLNPVNAQPADVATPLEAVAFVDSDTVTAVVPKDRPVGDYDLIVVNPDGSVGLKSLAFSVKENPPPAITTVVPASIVSATGQTMTINGTNFVASTLSMTCVDSNGALLATQPVVSANGLTCNAGVCAVTATVTASPPPAGAVCVLRVTNEDGSYADFSAIGVTTPSLNLSNPKVGPDLTKGRRALVAAAGDATSAARFVYAIGGDGGDGTAPFDDIEFAAVDLFGNFKPWQPQAYKLNQARAFASVATIGRYIYVYGGSGGSGPLASTERALILSPRETPRVDITDIVPINQGGLDAGYWFYKVSALFADSDPDNPGGESLPSDEIIVKVPTFPGKKIQLDLAWTTPVGPDGQALPNIAKYRIYRSAAVTSEAATQAGQEVLLAEVDGATLTFSDDGTKTPDPAVKPLTTGSTGKWRLLGNLSTARQAAGGAVAVDPDPADANRRYIYALLGRGASGLLTSYEYLDVTIDPLTGRQTPGTWKTGTGASSAGREEIGGFSVDATVHPSVQAGQTWIYLGGGKGTSKQTEGRVEAGLVGADGDLGTLDDAPGDFSASASGYGVCAANGSLFIFGGGNSGPTNSARAARITTAPNLANNAWNNEGLQMTTARYLLGSAVQSSFIFLVGGQSNTAAASKSTELVIW